MISNTEDTGYAYCYMIRSFDTLRPRQNGSHFANDIFKCIFLNENVSISIKISLKFIPMGLINNIPALVQIMAWHGPGDKPLSEPMISLKFIPTGPINNIPALVQIMAWRGPGNKPLAEPVMVNLPTHICITRPQWVKNVSDTSDMWDVKI